MKRLSPAIIQQIKEMLPKTRREIKRELFKWNEYIPNDEFYSDKEVIASLPFAAYEYLIILRDVRIDKPTMIQWLNEGLFKKETLNRVLAHTLRKLA